MKRADAFKLLELKLKNKNLIKHSLAVEACMKRLAKKFDEDTEMWGLAGLLHDLDYEDTKDDFSRHGFVTADMLEEQDVDDQVIDAIKAHPGHTERKTVMAKALFAVDPLTGLIVAACLMHPEKKLDALNREFVLKRFKEKSFARGVSREQIRACLDIGLLLEDFVDVCLEAMKEISNDLGM
ncbi:MAG: HDIG domain-containing protein [Candidatus Aureabacteria bacterium]|nr:HDIG domain-containing protein [Candidatus Auribacterota bacterium]